MAPINSRRVALRTLLLWSTAAGLVACGGGADESAPAVSPPATPAPPPPPPSPPTGRTYVDDYPIAYRTSSPNDVDPWAFYFRECTSFVAWRLNRDRPVSGGTSFFFNGKYAEIPTLNPLSGQPSDRFSNAEFWHQRALSFGVRVDTTPAIGAVAHWGLGELSNLPGGGHVAYVERVNSDGSVDVTEYNYGASPNDHQFGYRLDVSAPRYIHVEDWPVLGLTVDSRLYWVGTSESGLDTLVGYITMPSGALQSPTDVVLTRSGGVYAVTLTALYRVDPHTAVATPIGSGLGFPNVNALGADDAGNLYAATTSGQLLTVNRQTGVASLVGNYGFGLNSDGDIEFAASGEGFATIQASSLNSVLARIAPSTGLASAVGTNTGFADVYSLAFVGDQLFGLTSDADGRGTLVTLDTSTGSATQVRRTSFAAR